MSTYRRSHENLNAQEGTPIETTKGHVCRVLAEADQHLTAKDIEFEAHITENQRKRALKELQDECVVIRFKHPSDGRKYVYGLRGTFTERSPDEI